MAYDKFLYPANTRIASLLQVPDLVDTTTKTVAPVLDVSTALAFTQAQAYCDVSFKLATYKEKYNRIGYTFTVRNYPLISIESLKVNGVVLTENIDYTIEDSSISLITTSDNLVLILEETTLLYPKLTAIIEYEGGIETIDKNSILMYAVVTQAMVNYNRKATMGLGTIQGAGFSNSQLSSISSASDTGDLLSTVMSLLDPLVNNEDIQDVY